MVVEGDDLLELDGSVGVTAEGGDGRDTIVLVGETNEASLSGVEVVVGSAGDDSLTVSTNDIEAEMTVTVSTNDICHADGCLW